MSKRNFEIDMCNGPIFSKLVSFALPLCLSSILQLMFNAVDIIVVGRFTGKEALAAVGATTALIQLMTNLFIGISLGANVLSARYFAAKKGRELSETVHTSVLFAFLVGVVMLFVGQVLSRPALKLMATPDNIIDLSAQYMKIYFCGMPFFMLYNYGAAILRAVGDTKRPLIYLVISGVVNAVLNCILVAVFNMGVAGVAIATVVSQMLSCLFTLGCLFKSKSDYKLSFTKLRINQKHLLAMMKIGLPAGIQSCVINLSNSLLQSSVNSFGDTAMAGYAAANNLFGFMYAAVNSITQTCMSFTSQNYGAGKPDRMDKIFRDCVAIQIVFPLAMGTLVYVFAGQLLSIYNTDPEVISFGIEVLAYTAVTYFICGLMDMFPGALRGLGASTIPMILSVVGTVGTRIVWIFGVFPSHRSVKFLFISYPLSWIITLIMQIVCYGIVRKKVYSELRLRKGM